MKIIAAIDKNRVIGINNHLPWHLPEDLFHFKKLTLNKTIVMGRKTYESIRKILPHRNNIIISSNMNYNVNGAMILPSFDKVLQLPNLDEIIIIGGASLYSQAIQYADLIYLTIINLSFQGDRYFPNFFYDAWKEIYREDHIVDSQNPFEYTFLTLKRSPIIKIVRERYFS